MEVFLLQKVEKLGEKGEVVRVREGFGRNFLIPRKLALLATRQNKVWVEGQRQKAEERKARKREASGKLAERIASLGLQIEAASGEKDKLFGSVTTQDIAEALVRQGFAIDRKQLHLPEPIRSLGRHTVMLHLDPDLHSTLQVEVVKKTPS